jgi:hypothetical protein
MRLPKLSIESRRGLPEGAALPAQLQTLHLNQCRDLASVLALQQLQHLTLCPDFVPERRVLGLSTLPALQTVELSYRKLHAAAGAASTWVLLPQLRVSSCYWIAITDTQRPWLQSSSSCQPSWQVQQQLLS